MSDGQERVGEVGIQTFPREFGTGNATSPKNIYRTIVDMIACHRRVFSDKYALPVKGDRAKESE